MVLPKKLTIPARYAKIRLDVLDWPDSQAIERTLVPLHLQQPTRQAREVNC